MCSVCVLVSVDSVLILGNLNCAEIYRNKLEQCVADGKLNDEDVKTLLRLRVLLCIPQEIVDAAHAEICGRIFAKVLVCVWCSCITFCRSVNVLRLLCRRDLLNHSFLVEYREISFEDMECPGRFLSGR